MKGDCPGLSWLLAREIVVSLEGSRSAYFLLVGVPPQFHTERW